MYSDGGLVAPKLGYGDDEIGEVVDGEKVGSWNVGADGEVGFTGVISGKKVYVIDVFEWSPKDCDLLFRCNEL